jgi:hypothetical protein
MSYQKRYAQHKGAFEGMALDGYPPYRRVAVTAKGERAIIAILYGTDRTEEEAIAAFASLSFTAKIGWTKPL